MEPGETGQAHQIARPIDIPQRWQFKPAQPGAGETVARLRHHPLAAPVDPGKERRLRTAQPDEDIAAILGRDEDRVIPGVVPQGGSGSNEMHRLQHRTIAADQQQRAAGVGKGRRHPLAEIAGRLRPQIDAAAPPQTVEGERPADPPRAAWTTRLLDAVEWAGNLLPHPVTLFALLAVFIVLLSGLFAALGIAVDDPRPEGAAGRAADGTIAVVSLLDGEGLRRIVTGLVTNFTQFVPLGTVLVAMLGVGIAERSGLLTAAIRALVLRAPRSLVTAVVVFAGVLSNTASEMGYVVLVPLAAAIFHALGRHPLAGLAAAFAGVSGGYSANLLIGTVDPLLAGITQEAARLIDPAYEVHAAVNWYFMIVSTFLITVLGTFVTVRIVEPKLGPYDAGLMSAEGPPEVSMAPLTPRERRGLRNAGLAALAVAALVALLTVPAWGALREPGVDDTLASLRPFLTGIVALVFVFFAVPGFVYGRTTGSLRSDRDGDLEVACGSTRRSQGGTRLPPVWAQPMAKCPAREAPGASRISSASPGRRARA